MATKGAKAEHHEETGKKQGMKLLDPDMKVHKRIPRLQTKLLIDNRWVDSVKGTTFATINPSTGEKICDVVEAHAEDVDRAVRAAKRAFPEWSRKTGLRR